MTTSTVTPFRPRTAPDTQPDPAVLAPCAAGYLVARGCTAGDLFNGLPLTVAAELALAMETLQALRP
jgi:hypothetical protein